MSRSRKALSVVCLAALFLLASSVPASADLVGWWNFDDEEALDLSGKGNDGTDNGVTYTDDTYNNSGFALDIVPNTSVVVPHSDSLDLNDTMTIAFWMKADNDLQPNNWNGPMSKSADVPDRLGWEFQRFDDQSRLDIRVDTDEGANSVRGNVTGTYDDDWVHVAWTLDEGEVVSFLDGELIEIGAYPHGDGFANEEADFVIGCRAENWCVFEGLLDDIGIWNEVLSDEAIEALAAGKPPVGPPDPPDNEPGDYNKDGVLDAADVDLQSAEMKKDAADQDLALYDHNEDKVVNVDDRLIWVKDLRKTWVGDSNLDNEFNSSDLVQVFASGKYEQDAMAGWGEGDWDGNMRFESSDLVFAFSDGGYEQGPPAAAGVPEPAGLTLLVLACFALPLVRRRRG